MRFFALFLLLIYVLIPTALTAQTVHQELQETVKAEVINVVDEYQRDITGTDAVTQVQELEVRLEEGERRGSIVTIENELVDLGPGDQIFINRLVLIDGTEVYTFKDVERRGWLVLIFLGFVLVLLMFAGWQGARALFSLGLSVLAILFILVPALLAGYSAALVSLGTSAIVLALVLFLTHGVNPRSVIAFMGTLSAVVITCVVALVWVGGMRLTGFGSDASVYLNFATNGSLDFAGLLLGSIIIGILGVLDDVSITQASVVQELKSANPSFTFYELYRRAIRVGRDHVGSLVNTLALAYVGVSLPLVLLFAQSEASWWVSLNQEVVAAELLRIMVGSIGLVLAVPFTTAAAAWYFRDKTVDELDGMSCGHHHHH